MKIVLIDPPTTFEQIYGDWDLSALDTYCPPLGLLYIASYVREQGHDPTLIDVAALKWSRHKSVDHTLSLNPDVVGITAKTINVHSAADIATELKARGFRGPIVIGGAHVTAVPTETLSLFSAFDYGVIGEGEITFLELVKTLEQRQPVREVQGLAWRNDGGKIVINGPRPWIEDLDTLPLPAWDLLPNFPDAYPHSALESKQLPAASLITSRGCPYQCTFCDTAIFGSKVRHHSSEYTLKMIRHLRKAYGIRDLMFLDDNFILDRKKLFAICDAMIEERMNLSWYCMGHAKLLTEDRLSKIRQAGCWFIEIGIESGSERILKLIRKNITKSEVRQAVARARRAGLKVKGNFIFGFPTETKDSLEETIRFSLNIGLSYFQQNFLAIWPGCELAVNPEKYGQVEKDWRRLAHQRVTFIPNGLSKQDLIHASKSAFRRFYLRPRIILEVAIYSLTSWRTLKNALRGQVIFLKTILRKTKPDRWSTQAALSTGESGEKV